MGVPSADCRGGGGAFRVQMHSLLIKFGQVGKGGHGECPPGMPRWGIYIIIGGHATHCPATGGSTARPRACAPERCWVRSPLGGALLSPRAPARLRLRRQPVPVPSSEVLPLYMHPQTVAGRFASAVCDGDVGPLHGWGDCGGVVSVQHAANGGAPSGALLQSCSMASSTKTGAWGVHAALRSTPVSLATAEQGMQPKSTPLTGLILAIF
jgi:hypothetical protein